MSDGQHRNRLADEPSLYLKQHAANPVDWYPWGEEALSQARAEDKPILLSVGYSACHWCHVMERESFENEEIARLMNELFVCIKVDREERPDVDGLYMKAVQAMTHHGGWPMTVFLTPDGKPFYAGTYFPPEERGGMPGFPRVLRAVASAFRDRREEVAESADRVAEFLRKEVGSRADDDPAALDRAGEALIGFMDAEHGGFGQTPKFPGSMCLSFLLGLEAEASTPRRRELLETSLDRMAAGGIHDQLGGGFHRYSVDRVWLVPHFEKMLYDQALLANLYGEAWRAFGDRSYAEVATGILEYVVREMSLPEGGFASTQDADSEGVEGKYFVWTPDEVEDVVGAEDAGLVCRYFDVSEPGNFEGENILRRTISIEDAGRMFERPAAEVVRAIERARGLLLERRRTRVPPARDDKALADWNGLMISAMARVGRLLGRRDLVERASTAATFVRRFMMTGDRLYHFYAEGQARVDAFLDDWACFGKGALDLFYATGERRELESARHCAERLLAGFHDAAVGGFRFANAEGEQLIASSRDMNDGAVPAGNSVAAGLLFELFELTAEPHYLEAAEATLAAFRADAARNPYGAGYFLEIERRRRRGQGLVVIVGAGGATGELEERALREHRPELAVLVVPSAEAPWLPPALKGKSQVQGRATAYVCRAEACSAPVTEPDELAEVMRGG